MTQMRMWRLVIVGGLLPLAIAGALTLSASATITLLTSQGVPPAIAPAGVLMLEVASLAGTLLWVLVENRSLRRDARLVTLAATAVSVAAGLFAYGPIGAVGGVMLVAVVHLASRAWREPWTVELPVTQTPMLPDSGPDRVPEPPAAGAASKDVVEYAGQWAAGELRAKRTAGRDRIRAEFPDLSADDARTAARRGRELAAEPPVRLVAEQAT